MMLGGVQNLREASWKGPDFAAKVGDFGLRFQQLFSAPKGEGETINVCDYAILQIKEDL
jgi:hypothetical protein